MKLVELFIVFGRIGLFGFGGGPAFIPLMQREVVDAKAWLTKEQFLDAFAFGNALPGPITTKLAGYIGYRLAGWPGAAAALFGLTLPTIAAMILLATLYWRYQEHPAIQGFMTGVRPVVIALLLLVVWAFVPSAFGKRAVWLKNWPLWLLAAASFVLAVFYGVHPALLIVAGGLLGLTVLREI